ncbi:MAG: glycosyltransferase [Gammaproteobacteria bacterium]|nr:glycosyltransferase [Gammaproteobacteria bacterium]
MALPAKGQIAAMTDFHIVIACNEPDGTTKRMLESLSKCVGLREWRQIWFIENGVESSNFDVSVCSGWSIPIDHVVLRENGQARARQWFLEKGLRGFALFFDADIVVDSMILEAYRDAVNKNGRGIFYGGPMKVEYERSPEDWLIRFLPRSVAGWSIEAATKTERDNLWFLGGTFGAFIDDMRMAGGSM